MLLSLRDYKRNKLFVFSYKNDKLTNIYDTFGQKTNDLQKTSSKYQKMGQKLVWHRKLFTLITLYTWKLNKENTRSFFRNSSVQVSNFFQHIEISGERKF